MTAHMTVAPAVAKPGQVLAVDFWLCPEPTNAQSEKLQLTTLDSAGTESGWDVKSRLSTNINRLLPDGSIRVGIKAPPLVGPAKVIAYINKVRVAEAPVLVKA